MLSFSSGASMAPTTVGQAFAFTVNPQKPLRGHLSRLKIEKMAKLTVKVNTKSNYRNLNGEWLEVYEIIGRRVTCSIHSYPALMDFTVDEISEWKMPAEKESK